MADTLELGAKSVANVTHSVEPPVVEMVAQSTTHLSSIPSKHEPDLVHRRIIAEDLEWNVVPIANLTQMCITVIVSNFESNRSYNLETPILQGLPLKCRDEVINSLSTSLPLSIAGPFIPDMNYWKRRSKEYYRLASVCDHGNDWKRLFFESYLQSSLEEFVPSLDFDIMEEKMGKLKQVLDIASPYVYTLKVRQLRPLKWTPQPDDLEVAMSDTKVLGNPTTRTLDHLDIGFVISHLKQLKEVSLYYGYYYITKRKRLWN
jgi:hypothetical protein